MLGQQKIRPLGDGRFQTEAGVFNTYAEAMRSITSAMSPAIERPKPVESALDVMSGAMPFTKANAAVNSSPFSPVSKPQGLIEGLNVGGRGSYAGPATEETPINTGSGFTQEPQQEQSFMDKLFSKQGLGAISNTYLASRNDPALRALGTRGLDQAQTRKSANATVDMLRKNGQNDLADMIEQNPTMAKTALTQFLQQKYGSKSGLKTSQAFTDPDTGQKYVIATDPNTGSVTRMNVEGATGLTPEQEAGLESSNALKLADMKRSQTAAADTYKQFSNISSQIRNLETIKSELNTGNARTGVIDQFMPAFSEATATLRSAANSLGIDVINSATFGALSATELKLALDTALPQGLDEPQLLEWVNKKLEAQKKLQREIAKQADRLASGVPYTDWVKEVVKPFTQNEGQPSGSNTVRVKY